ncbi:hypothetical protein [Microbacterium sp. Leaf151]|uniref:hypothetical protein n=1 Tax=Microbacterium sp. Leaf151 TaxID=1736276 RepID=UPI0006F453A3|nr:hypothetical protein [Microbacterium sp. Leaf151]KQR25775.1 hypothetical protein ASF76_00260 [Microbacterium sp. Leaf151]
MTVRQPTVPASLDDLFEDRWERDAQVEEDARSFVQQMGDLVGSFVEWTATREWWELCLMGAIGVAAVVAVTAVVKLRPRRYRLR